jgi:hypothetical protein
VSLNPAHGEVYSIQLNVIKFVIDLQQVGVFLHQYNWPPRHNWDSVHNLVRTARFWGYLQQVHSKPKYLEA